MKNIFLSLVLASISFVPAFASETATVKTEPKKVEEPATKPAAPQQKKEGAVLVSACEPCTTPEKKDTTKEDQAKAKTAPAPKAILA